MLLLFLLLLFLMRLMLMPMLLLLLVPVAAKAASTHAFSQSREYYTPTTSWPGRVPIVLLELLFRG